MAARKKIGTKVQGWPTLVRERIKAGMLLKALQDHVKNKRDMTQTQLKAAEILLRKCLPDLSQVSGTIGHVNLRPDEMDDATLAAIATGRSTGASAEETGEEEPDQLH